MQVTLPPAPPGRRCWRRAQRIAGNDRRGGERRRYLWRGAVLGQVSGPAAVAAGDGLVGAVVPRAVPRAPAVRDLRLRREKTFSTGPRAPCLLQLHTPTGRRDGNPAFYKCHLQTGLSWVILSQGHLRCLEEKYCLVQTPTSGLHFFCRLNS